MNVLVVDDQNEGRIFLEQLVRYMGHDTVTADNGRMALDLLATNRFDLVISDILMPVMDGYQMCRAIKSDPALSQTPVMFLTATYTEEQDQELADRMGAEMLVRKPIEARKLMSIIGQMLTGSSSGAPSSHPETDGEKEILDLYSKRLIYQLEKKMVELEDEVQERIRKEHELLHSQQQFRSLSAHLQNVREEERMHLAREIHDELGQALTALRMDAKYIESRVSGKAVLGKVHSMIEFIDRTSIKVQSICSELRPSILDDLGLSVAMDWLVNEYGKRVENTEFRFEYQDDERVLPEEISTAAFRILQEALTNVIKHARAGIATITLEISEERLFLSVVDDGEGFDMKDLDRSGSFGLLGMRERALSINGILKIDSVPGRGTRVTVTIPLKGEEYEH